MAPEEDTTALAFKMRHETTYLHLVGCIDIVVMFVLVLEVVSVVKLLLLSSNGDTLCNLGDRS